MVRFGSGGIHEHAFGGPSLLVSTVEQLTRIHDDHFAVIDFAGFAQMTDAVGGLDLTVGVPSQRGGVTVPARRQHLDGAQALVYVRERYALPAGDLDRVRRQQNALRELVTRAVSSGSLSSPSRAYTVADTVTRYVGVDDSLSDIDLATTAFGFRDLRPQAVDFLTVPITGTGTEGAQSVVYLDRPAGNDLWFAVNTDATSTWAASHPSSRLGDDPR